MSFLSKPTFVDPDFFAFFLLVGAVYWALRTNGPRKLWLLAASYVFYAAWDWRFLGLIFATTAVDFYAARRIEAAPTKEAKRRWLRVSLGFDLGMLAFFKYFDFFIESGTGLLHVLGLKVEPMRLGIVLPIGISFYTFQSLSYTIDVYRGRLATRKSFLDYALFVSCFPQLLAGPIMRAAQYLPQLDTKRRLADVEVRSCLTLFFFGFVKKTCVADRLALVVGQVFANPDAVGVSGRWIGAWLFIVQLYCDFSGYSDMAKATSGLLGYRLVDNFRHPFVARSVNDFWSRWHISLTTWIRDYLYLYLDSIWLRLGGARGSRWRIYFALFGVYTAVGLWHGASFNFILFGAYAGLFVVLETAGKLAWITKRTYLAHAYVLLFVTFLGVFFRAGELGHIGSFLAGMFGFAGPATQPVNPLWALVLPAFLVGQVAMYKGLFHGFFRRLPDWGFAAVLGTAVALALPWVTVGYQAFVYFQF